MALIAVFDSNPPLDNRIMRSAAAVMRSAWGFAPRKVFDLASESGQAGLFAWVQSEAQNTRMIDAMQTHSP